MSIRLRALAAYLALAAGLTAQRVPAPSRGAASPTGQAGGTASLEGTVTDTATIKPLGRVRVTLNGAPTPQGVHSYSAVTDDAGKYAILGIAAGSYQIKAARSGYLDMVPGNSGPQSVSIGSSQHKTGVDLRLTPQAVIAGRVIQEGDQPVPETQVLALAPRYIRGVRRLVAVNTTTTDDRGRYRLWGLSADRYLIAVRARATGEAQAVDLEAKDFPENYVATYYPGTLDAAKATAVELDAGATENDITVKLARVPTARIRGRAINQTGTFAHAIAVTLMSYNAAAPVLVNETQVLASGPDKSFEFRGLTPGAYELIATISAGLVTHTARQVVNIGANNADAVVLVIGQPYPVSGEFRVEAQGASFDLSKLQVSVTWSDQRALASPLGTQTTVAGADGRFVFAALSPDRYAFSVNGPPEGWYVKSVRSGERDVLDTGLDLTGGVPPEPLVVTLSNKAAQIRGIVLDEGKPLADAIVAVVPQKPAWRVQEQFYRTANTDANGQFTARDLTPGDYTVYAWREVEPGAWMDAAFLEGSAASKVTLAEGSTETVTVKRSGGIGK